MCLGILLEDISDLLELDSGEDGAKNVDGSAIVDHLAVILDELGGGHIVRGAEAHDGWELEVLTHVTLVVHEENVVTLETGDHPVGLGNNWDVDGVGGWAELLTGVTGEDIVGEELALGMSVLSGLGDGNILDLAGLALDHDVSTLADRTGLNGDGHGGTGISGVNFVIGIVRHGLLYELEAIGTLERSRKETV